jgi:hypothetical protein
MEQSPMKRGTKSEASRVDFLSIGKIDEVMVYVCLAGHHKVPNNYLDLIFEI